MIYTGVYLEKKFIHYVGDDIELSFIIKDQKNNILDDFTNVTIKCNVEGAGFNEQLSSENSGEITVQSGNIITINIPSASSVQCSETYFTVEIQIEIGTKVYTVYQNENFYLLEENLDW